MVSVERKGPGRAGGPQLPAPSRLPWPSCQSAQDQAGVSCRRSGSLPRYLSSLPVGYSCREKEQVEMEPAEKNKILPEMVDKGAITRGEKMEIQGRLREDGDKGRRT